VLGTRVRGAFKRLKQREGLCTSKKQIKTQVCLSKERGVCLREKGGGREGRKCPVQDRLAGTYHAELLSKSGGR